MDYGRSAMHTSAQLRFAKVTFERPDRTILADIELTVAPGDRIGLTGPNGSGKSTLLALASGALSPTQGSVTATPRTATVGLMGQELASQPGETVRRWVRRRLGIVDAEAELEEATRALAEVPQPAGTADRYDAALQRWLGLGGADLDDRLPAALEQVGLGASRLDDDVEIMSGGERGRIRLAALRLASVDILLLDEPTNDLDSDGIELLERELLSTPSPFVLVSHDRRLLERVVDAVVELDPHDGSARRFDGGWQSYLDERAVARAHHQRAFDDYTSKLDELKARARTERAWASKGANRAARNPRDGDKIIRNHAIETSENLAARARRTERAIERLDVVDKPWEPWRLQFDFGAFDRSGDVVVELDGAVVEQGDFTLGPIDLRVSAGERVHLAGANGSGKTTLLRALLGDVSLSVGRRRIGASVSVGLIDQRRGFAEPPLEYLEAVSGADLQECRSVLAKFGLGHEYIVRRPDELSPGERTRTLLAAFMLRGVNTVVLDEPTNHLDIEAIEQLESALERFRGTLIVVSHDRAFLDAVDVTRTIDLAG